ncbi:hypothetical protein [Lysobacter gummosus]|uniref:hypothetical protein n=1 Tax=Lysobacter gummosus TaxID=262324 RepID=UPI0036318971
MASLRLRRSTSTKSPERSQISMCFQCYGLSRFLPISLLLLYRASLASKRNAHCA